MKYWYMPFNEGIFSAKLDERNFPRTTEKQLFDQFERDAHFKEMGDVMNQEIKKFWGKILQCDFDVCVFVPSRTENRIEESNDERFFRTSFFRESYRLALK